MRLKELRIAGFRGFNEERTLQFHDRLTVVGASNSHGKTSITEALEFLLYGETSKVQSADSKDEYKDSYVNRHYVGGPSFISAVFRDASTELSLRVELQGGGIRRFVNGERVDSWPFADEAVARPFVVQHALKRLLLAPPGQRFQGFARLLGLEEVDVVQQALVNLCTKPEAQLPKSAKQLTQQLSVFEDRLKLQKTTEPIAKALARGAANLDDTFDKAAVRGRQLLGKSVVDEGELLGAMVALRNDSAAKVYSGSIAIRPLNEEDRRRLQLCLDQIERLMTGLIAEYDRIGVADATERTKAHLQLLELGLRLLSESPGVCPFCGQAMSESQGHSASRLHEQLAASLGSAADLATLRGQLIESLKRIGVSIRDHSAILRSRYADIVAASEPEATQRIKALFGNGNEYGLFLLQAAIAAITPLDAKLVESAAGAKAHIDAAMVALRATKEQVSDAERVVECAAQYLKAADEVVLKLAEIEPTLAEPSQLLRQAVDAVAGTQELTLLIELFNHRSAIRRAVRIRDILGGLKALKKEVDRAVGETMENAFASHLTDAVMKWYHRIRTHGDPDVHFSRFAMERNKAGDFKNRRVRVEAHSYGVELASAVSSLSESKLNALGLCMSIAAVLRSPGRWEFLILDDPIQSWDDDHEVQFIDIVRTLTEEEGKQIILLSHRENWIDQVVDGCRTINGTRYEITGYTKAGPELQVKEWATVDQRLREILAIINDATANSVKLQQAEQEVRIAACQLVARAAKTKLTRSVAANTMNSDKARAVLVEAGCAPALVDRLSGTFATTDDSHHAPKEYQPNAQRIRRYHGALVELKNWIDS